MTIDAILELNLIHKNTCLVTVFVLVCTYAKKKKKGNNSLIKDGQGQIKNQYPDRACSPSRAAIQRIDIIPTMPRLPLIFLGPRSPMLARAEVANLE